MDRSYSLRKNKEFRYVYNAGKSVGTRNIVVVYRHKRTPGLRVGFSVSKKVGNSVKRNLVRRRLREAFRSYIDGIDPRVLIVIVAKPASAGADFWRLKADMGYALRKAELLKIDD